MLLSLNLKNFVLVDELEISFPVGFTVMTGETGAGKSILIDALKLLLGGRGDAGVVRTGKAKADLFGTFSPTSEASAWLAKQDLQNGEDGLLLLRRSIDAQGRSRAWINGMPATVAQLKALGELGSTSTVRMPFCLSHALSCSFIFSMRTLGTASC